MIPASHLFDQPTMTTLLENDPVVSDYRSFFSFLDWSVVDQWKAQQSRRGRPAQDIAAYIKAFLIRIRGGASKRLCGNWLSSPAAIPAVVQVVGSVCVSPFHQAAMSVS